MKIRIGLVFLLLALIAGAHHGYAQRYESKTAIHLSGPITDIRFINPHAWVKIHDTATNVDWDLELQPVLAMLRRGVDKTKLTNGTVITVDGFQSVLGPGRGYAYMITLVDGTKYILLP